MLLRNGSAQLEQSAGARRDRGVRGATEGRKRLLRRSSSRLRPPRSLQAHASLGGESIGVSFGANEVARVAEEAAKATQKSGGGNGPFTFVASGLEFFLKEVHGVLEKLGVPYSYGWAIILLTLLVKAATFPLTKKQIESTNAMQALQPRVKELQQKYANDQQRLQLETSKLYQQAGVNPLAGILPTLATLPVWIGLYRALTNVAKEGLLTEGFFWIPSLAGPSTLADRDSGVGLQWLFPLKNGVPPIGWHDAIAYLVLPVLLVASQIVSQRLISPQSTQSQNAQANILLKVLPFVLGWFSLNVPSGLTLYWFTNNILSTAQSVYLKRNAPTPSIPSIDESEKPAREYVEAEVNKSKPSSSKEPTPAADSTAQASGFGGGSSSSKKSNRGNKFKERKAKESAQTSQLPPDPEREGNGANAAAKQEKQTDTSS